MNRPQGLAEEEDAQEGGDYGFHGSDDRDAAVLGDFLHALIIEQVGPGGGDQGVEEAHHRYFQRRKAIGEGAGENSKEHRSEEVAVGADDPGVRPAAGHFAKDRSHAIGDAGAHRHEEAEEGNPFHRELAAGDREGAAGHAERHGHDLPHLDDFAKEDARGNHGAQRRQIQKHRRESDADFYNGFIIENIIDTLADETKERASKERPLVHAEGIPAELPHRPYEKDSEGEKHSQKSRELRRRSHPCHDHHKDPDGPPKRATRKDVERALPFTPQWYRLLLIALLCTATARSARSLVVGSK